VAFPYVVTYKKYQGAQDISDLFPIAVMENGHVEIIKWPQYEENPGAFIGKLVLPPMEGKIASSEYSSFELEAGREKAALLSLYEEDYTFWAEYALENGFVRPISFRFTGGFVIFYCFLVAFVGTPLVGWLFRKIGIRSAESEA
jgi:hypothetical protein